MRLDRMTWKEAEAYINEEIIAIIPVGSVEQHGPLGPLGTDYIVPDEISRRLETENGVLVMPVMPYGVCPSQDNMAGTIDIGCDVFKGVMRNIAMGIMGHGVKKLIFINGHGGNTAPLSEISLVIYRQGGLAAVVDWWSLAHQLDPAWVGGHGGSQEASAMMACRPDWVNKNRYEPTVVRDLTPDLETVGLGMIRLGKGTVRIARDVLDVTPSGAYGSDDPKAANRQLGEEMLDGVTAYIREFIKEFKKVSLQDRCRKEK